MLRVCSYFFVLQLFFFFFACFPALLVLFASLVYLCCLCGSLGVVVVSFSLSDYTQKERAQFLASSLVLLWVVDLVGVRFPVLVKFVIVSLNLFGYTFIGGRIFVIISPLLEKTFENAIDKFPRIEVVFYALVYVI